MYAELKPSSMLKVCGDCKVEKPASEFNKDKGKLDGLHWCCVVCRKKYRQQPKVKAATSEYNKAQRLKNPEATKKRDREYTLRRYWGMTTDEFEKLMIKHNRKCGICGKKERSSAKKPLVIDHDHKTGAIRGLLCDNCNRGIGLLQDSKKLLQNAIAYLDQVLEAQDKKPAR